MSKRIIQLKEHQVFAPVSHTCKVLRDFDAGVASSLCSQRPHLQKVLTLRSTLEVSASKLMLFWVL